jgi:hypothetical protein
LILKILEILNFSASSAARIPWILQVAHVQYDQIFYT